MPLNVCNHPDTPRNLKSLSLLLTTGSHLQIKMSATSHAGCIVQFWGENQALANRSEGICMDYTILICDDDDAILSVLEIYLRQDGYQVIRATNGIEALDALSRETVHLVLLDVMMPELDGIQTAVKIREHSNVPILFLSAKSEEVDCVLGLTMGGDDYITKPFNPVELLARIKAALRRYARLGGMDQISGEKPGATDAAVREEDMATPGAAKPESTSAPATTDSPAGDPSAPTPAQPGKVYQTGDLILDDEQKRVTLDGEEVQLTALEYNILRFLMEHMDYIFSSDQIYEMVWGKPAFEVSKTVSVHIRHIREKIEINPKDPRYLKVIYGLGYRVVKLK